MSSGVGRREKVGVKIQTTIDTSPDIILPHAPPHVEENMPENHSRRRLGFFERRMKPHASTAKRVSVGTDGASGDAPTVVSEKKIKNWLITGTPLTPRPGFCLFRGVKSSLHCSF